MNVLFDEKVFLRIHEESLRNEGREEMLILLVEKGNLPINKAAEILNETPEEFSKKLHRS